MEHTICVRLNTEDENHAKVAAALATDEQDASIWGSIVVIGYHTWQLSLPLLATDNRLVIETEVQKRVLSAHSDLQWNLRLAEESRDRNATRFQELEADILRRIQQATDDVNRQRDRDAEHYQRRLEIECAQIRELSLACQGKEVMQLRETLSEREAEIRNLKNTNSVKGTEGEMLIQQLLRHNFVDHEVVDASIKPHHGDIELLDTSGQKLLMFEVKNKSKPQRSDVEKFLSNMRNAQRETIGGVFVSLQTPCIPGKGAMKFELVPETSQFVLFLGFEGPRECSDTFVRHIQLFISLCRMHNRLTKCADVSLWQQRYEVMVGDVRFLYDSLNRQRTQCKQFVAAIQEECTRMIDRIQVHINDTETAPKKRRRKS